MKGVVGLSEKNFESHGGGELPKEVTARLEFDQGAAGGGQTATMSQLASLESWA